MSRHDAASFAPAQQAERRRWLVFESETTIAVVDERALQIGVEAQSVEGAPSPFSDSGAATEQPSVPVLTVNRRSGRARESLRKLSDVLKWRRASREAAAASGASAVDGGKRAYAILGVLSAEGIAALLTVTKAECACEVDGKPIFEVLGVDVLPIDVAGTVTQAGCSSSSSSGGPAMSVTTLSCGPLFDGVIRLLCGRGFYFAQDFDITHTLQWKKRRVLEARRMGTDPVPRLADGTPDLMAAADQRFVWNRALVEQLTSQAGVSARWFTPLMQGFVQSIQHQHSIPTAPGWDMHVTLLLISRRGSGRAGTRYNARGLDDNGEVGNLCETEQLAKFRPCRRPGNPSPCPPGVIHGWLSLAQLRGSVPLFWEQPPQGTVNITRDAAITRPAYEKHQRGTEAAYEGDVFYVNLLAASSAERPLTQALEQQLCGSVSKSNGSGSEPKKLYCHFDFHARVKGASTSALDADMEALFTDIGPFLEKSGYLDATAETPSGPPPEPRRWQAGVLRTNCLDCLDRTNVVQFYVAWFWLRAICQSRPVLQGVLEPELSASTAAGVGYPSQKAEATTSPARTQNGRSSLLDGGGAALQKLGKVGGSLFDMGNYAAGQLLAQASGRSSSASGDDLLSDGRDEARDAGPPILRRMLQELWADQGDRVSQQYTGAGSIMSTLLREGKKTSYAVLEKGCIGINRAFQASFQDAQRQECIDMLLGLHRSNVGLPCLKGHLNGAGESGKGVGTLSIWAGTWNVNGREEAWIGSSNAGGIAEWLGPTPCDIACFCLQELVELNPATAMLHPQGHDARATLFESVARQALVAKWGDAYAKIRTVGAAGLCCIVFIREALAPLVRDARIARVKFGSVGTRGAVAVRFELLSTSFCIICLHHDGGVERSALRVAQLREALHCFDSATPPLPPALDHDFLAVAGCLNAQLDLPAEDNMEDALRASLKTSWADHIASSAASNGAEVAEKANAREPARAWRSFLPYDQLISAANQQLEHLGLAESRIGFPPTSRLKPYTDDYEEARPPAWSDRVLYRTTGVQVIDYRTCSSLNGSDHRPVCARLETMLFGSAADRGVLEAARSRCAAAAACTATATPTPNGASTLLSAPAQEGMNGKYVDDFALVPAREQPAGTSGLASGGTEPSVAILSPSQQDKWADDWRLVPKTVEVDDDDGNVLL